MKYDQKRISVNKWKSKFKNNKEGTLAKNSNRPNPLNEELLLKAKDVC